MASFGWSAGDIITTITLVTKLIHCISGSHTSRHHFQELLSELQSLSRALHEISTLTQFPDQTPEIHALKFASCLCAEPLKRFYDKVQPFEDALAASSTKSRLKAAPRMVRWELLVKKDVPELRSYLVAHVGSLNLRLGTALLHGSSNTQMQGRAILQKQDVIAERLEQLLQVSTEQADVVRQISLIPNPNTMPQLDSLLSIANGVWKEQAAFMSQVTNPHPDLDHTWAQSPVKFEDALGRRFLIPSEYDWDMIEAVILAKFKKGPGRIKVHSGDYELFDRRTGRSVSESNFVGLIPGSNISMAMIIGRYRVDGLVPDGCTRMGCRSSQIRVINPETTTCMECQGLFRKAQKRLPRPMKPISAAETIRTSKATQAVNAASKDIICYKNISIYFVELPATPANFREKFPRGYPVSRPTKEHILDLKAAVQQSEPSGQTPVLSLRISSKLSKLLRNTSVSEQSGTQNAREKTSSRLRSMLQRQISRTPFVRLNFHSSAQERNYRRSSKKPSTDPAEERLDRPDTIVVSDPPPKDENIHQDAGLIPQLPKSPETHLGPDNLHIGQENDARVPPRPIIDPRIRGSIRHDFDHRPRRRNTELEHNLELQEHDKKYLEQLVQWYPPKGLRPTITPPSALMSASYVSHGDSFGPGVGIPSLYPSEAMESIPPPLSEAAAQMESREESISKIAPYWTAARVRLFLEELDFSTAWIQTFESLDIHGSTFLELGSGHGGRGNFGFMHQQVYPKLAKICSEDGTGWDQAREREEGKRLRRLIRRISN